MADAMTRDLIAKLCAAHDKGRDENAMAEFWDLLGAHTNTFVEELRAALTRPAAPGDVERSWRCFHCDEVFTSKDAAREHFGSSELDEPGCKMLAKGELELLRDYRDMAARWQRCVSEDCDASRIYCNMSAKIATTERDAEQRGYDKGLADGETRLRAAPRGWKLVPVELTEDMAAAIELAYGTEQLWRDALAAAPEAPR